MNKKIKKVSVTLISENLPEVTGDAAVYFDGYNTDDLAKKCIKF